MATTDEERKETATKLLKAGIAAASALCETLHWDATGRVIAAIKGRVEGAEAATGEQPFGRIVGTIVGEVVAFNALGDSLALLGEVGAAAVAAGTVPGLALAGVSVAGAAALDYFAGNTISDAFGVLGADAEKVYNAFKKAQDYYTALEAGINPVGTLDVPVEPSGLGITASDRVAWARLNSDLRPTGELVTATTGTAVPEGTGSILTVTDPDGTTLSRTINALDGTSTTTIYDGAGSVIRTDRTNADGTTTATFPGPVVGASTSVTQDRTAGTADVVYTLGDFRTEILISNVRQSNVSARLDPSGYGLWGGSVYFTIESDNSGQAASYYFTKTTGTADAPFYFYTSEGLTGVRYADYVWAPEKMSGSISVYLQSYTAGIFDEHETVLLEHAFAGGQDANGQNTWPLLVAPIDVELRARLYAPAVAQVTGAVIDLGSVHVGDTFSPNITISNVGSGALVDDLVGTLDQVSPFVAVAGNTTTGMIHAGRSVHLTPSLTVKTYGTLDSQSRLVFTSHDEDLADITASSNATALQIKGTAYEYASPAFSASNGVEVSRSGSSWTIDLGQILQGNSLRPFDLTVSNSAVGLVDALSGSIDLAGDGFDVTGPMTFSGQDVLHVTSSATASGPLLETITLHPISSNPSGYSGALADQVLVIKGSVVPAAPSAPTITAVSPSSGASATDRITGTGVLTISGSADSGTTVTLSDGATMVGSAKADGAGAWSIQPASPLTSGVHTLTAKASSGGGTSVASAGVNVVIDLTPPATPTIGSISPDTGRSAADGITSTGLLTIQGTAEAGSTVSLLDNGSTLLGTAAARSDGGYAIQLTTPLAEGGHDLAVRATDVSGNVSGLSATRAVVVDTTPPLAPFLSVFDNTGRSSTDGVTSAANSFLTGFAEYGATVSLYDGATLLATTTTHGGPTPTGTAPFAFGTSVGLAEGHRVLSARATDAAGNQGAAASLAIVVDTAAPAAPLVSRVSTPAGLVARGGSSRSGLFTATGTAEAGSTVALFDGTAAGAPLASGAADAAGKFALSLSAPLGSGAHSLVVQATDAAGNASPGSAGYSVAVASSLGDGDPLFDAYYYLSRNPDVAQAKIDPYVHYNQYGWHEGRSPDAYFDTGYYLAHNPDVARAGINPLQHFEQYGWKEGRDPSGQFDLRDYLAANPDVKAAGLDPLVHFLSYGQVEGRAAFAVPAGAPDPLVDAAYYYASNPDVRAAGLDAGTHYTAYGWHEGRNPDAYFDTNYYLGHDPDVAQAGINPLQHYEQYGWHEGRDPSAQFSTNKYLAAYGDVRAAGLDPLIHYLSYGQAEGRQAFPA